MRIDHGSHEVGSRELIIDIMKLSYEDWSSISWSWVIRIDNGYHEVELWVLVMDLMKFSDEDWSWISWSWIIWIDHRSHEVALWGLIINVMRFVIDRRYPEVELWRLIINLIKLGSKDWSWISWSCVMRIDPWFNEVEWQGLSMDLMRLCYEKWS